jgi:hypothetical protein
MGVSDVLANLIHHPVPLMLYLIGTLSWAVAVIAAAVALSQAGARRTSGDAAIYHRRLRAQSNAHAPGRRLTCGRGSFGRMVQGSCGKVTTA